MSYGSIGKRQVNLAARLHDPTAGKVFIDNQDITALSDLDLGLAKK